MTALEPDSHPTKPSGTKKTLKWLAMLGAVVAALLVCVVLLLTYWFPSELVREKLEVRLSDMLDGTVRIRTLSFNLLNGLSLQQVEFQQGSQLMLELDRLVLDYSLFGLLQRKLTINEVRIDGADLSLDLAELQAVSAPPEPEAPPPSSEPIALPAIPLTLDLESLTISRTNIELDVSPDLAVRIRDLNFEISGGVEDDAVQLKGDVTVAQVGVDLEEKQLRFPLGLSFDINAELPAQRLAIDHVVITSEPAFDLTLSGRIEEFLGAPSIDLSLDRARFDFERTLALVGDFVPLEFRDVQVSGILSPTLFVKGRLGDGGFAGEANMHIAIQDFQTDLDRFETKFDRTDFEVSLTDVAIKDNMPDAGTVEIHVQSDRASFQVYEVEGLDVQLAGDYFALGPVSANMTVSGTANLPPQEPLAALTLPFAVRFDARGNYRTQDATVKQLVVELGNLLTVQLEGTVKPDSDPSRAMTVDLKTRLEPRLEHILPLVPQRLLEDLSIEKLAASDFITVNAQGSLDPEYRPLDVDVSARVNMGNLTVKQHELSAGGTLEKMNFSLTTQYNAGKEDMQGTLTGTMTLAGLDYRDMAAVGQVDVALDTSFTGSLSSTFDLTELLSEQAVNLSVKNIQYSSPTVGVGVEELTMSAKLREDMDRRHYTVDALRVTSEALMDVQLAADFQQESREFDVSLDIPYVNVGELQRKLSGEAVQSLNELNPRGEIALSVKASGRVPAKQDIQALNIPVTLSTTLSLDNIQGAVGDYRVNGADGTVSFSFVPGDRPMARAQTDLSFGEVALGPGSPLERLSGTFATFNVTMDNFDAVEVKALRVGMVGADVSLEGTVDGIREIIEGKGAVMSNLPDLFAQLNTTARVSLDEFQTVLHPMGLAGTGQAQVGLAFLKKERGPLVLNVKLGSKGLELSQDGGMQIGKVDGQIMLRKRLDWLDKPGAKIRKQIFRPSDVLSQLRSIKGKEKSLTIDRLDLGFLTVSNVSANILFDQDAFKVQNLAMNVLNGGVGGNVIVTGGKAFGLTGRFEAAHLDLNQLLDEKLKISGDSVVDATLGLAVFFEQETGALDLSRTEMRIFITHIGREAVDRLLVFLDPEGSNPTLVSARSQIKLANPSSVSLQLARGMLSLEILFSEGLLQPFRLNRIPIGKIKQLKAATEGIPDWDNVREIMAFVGAQAYGLDEQGKLILR